MALRLDAQNIQLKIVAKDSLENRIFNSLEYQRFHGSDADVLKEVDTVQLRLQQLGYFDNRIDSIQRRDSLYTAFFFLGNSTRKIRIKYDPTIISKARIAAIMNKPNDDFIDLDVQQVPQFLNRLVRSYESEGKSFSRVQLLDLEIRKTEGLVAKLHVEVSKERTIDKIVLSGYESFPKSFLKHYLNLDTSTPFTTQKITELSNGLLTLPFVSEQKPAEVLFTKDSTYLYLYLKKEKANRFDGLVGFTSDDLDNRLLFNGYLDLELNNIFNGGEQIRLNWRSNGNDRQVFNLNFEFPFIFNSALSPSFNLDIYKQDSTFLNTALQLRVEYLITNRNKIAAFLNSKSSDNLLDQPQIDIQDLNATFYGVGYAYAIPNNNPLFPYKFRISSQAAFGRRTAEQTQTDQSELKAQANYLWSFNKRNHLFIQNETALLNSESFFTNELYRIGGVNSIRGFNEESIFASMYSVVNLEYRYTPNNTSYLYTISDAAFVRNGRDDLDQNIFSLGLGYAFRTNFGLLNLSYAIGKFDRQNFDFNNSRFHLKIVSNF